MSFIDLDLQADGIEQLQADLQATEKEVLQALRSTQTKMARWLTTRAARGLSSELDIKQKVIRRRLKSFRVGTIKSTGEIVVWFGLDPVAVIDLGARQNREGVKAGKRRIPGAFIARGAGGGLQVYRRQGAARLPIKKQTVDISDKAETFIEDKLLGTNEFDREFMKIFERELEWRMRKRT